MAFKVIACATDFSRQADLACSKALELARIHKSRIFLVHVIQPLIAMTPLVDEFIVTQATMALKDKLHQDSVTELKGRYAVESKGLWVRTVILEGNPAVELAAFVKREGVDLLVMGSTGLSGLAGVLFGSVAAKAVKRVDCSCLIVRKKPREEI